MLAPLALGGYTSDTLLSAPKHQPLELHLTAPSTPDAKLHLVKTKGESVEHVLLKALLWALLLPTHPDAVCERDLGLKYRPDVVALDGLAPVWWGECGSVKPSKLRDLALAFPGCRFSVCKWGRSDLRGYAAGLRKELDLPLRGDYSPPFELLNFPTDRLGRFLSDDGELTVFWDDIQSTPLVDPD